ncbi:MAG TPA: hypothetical protein DDW73_19855 [Rhizobium sp.]|jgi:hypothetical protein|nr:hypothetical protein [Rhizobium sp.]
MEMEASPGLGAFNAFKPLQAPLLQKAQNIFSEKSTPSATPCHTLLLLKATILDSEKSRT